MILAFNKVLSYIYQLVNIIKHWSSYFGLVDKQRYENTFYQLLHDKNYDDALRLAEQHKYLDKDLVYKCKWRNSGITVPSIDSVLGKIDDKLWVIHECVQTVPVLYEACKRLICFGLAQANLKLLYKLGNENSNESRYSNVDGSKFGYKPSNSRLSAAFNNVRHAHTFQPLIEEDISDEEVLGLIDFDHLNDQQRELCRCRQNLLLYQHSLSAYAQILGDYKVIQHNFDHVFYDENRRKCPLDVCIHHANEGDSHAVETCLAYYTDELKIHHLTILSNFSETQSPYLYRNLLPCLQANDKTFVWRVNQSIEQVKLNMDDWCFLDKKSPIPALLTSRAEDFENEIYKSNDYLRKYRTPNLTGDLITQWFIERALEIESRTLLLTCATQLLSLGTQLQIPNLTKTQDDLVEFDRVIYECCADDNIYLSYTEFMRMPEIDRLLLMTGSSLKTCNSRFRFFVLPYLHRRVDELKKDNKIEILRDYFHRLANSNEQLCRSIYDSLLDGIENDSFVASWTKDMDDVIDSIGEEIHTIERNRQIKSLSAIASQTLALGDWNECYEACQIIMAEDFKECWQFCYQLGVHKHFDNFAAKYKLLSFALAYCDDPDCSASVKMLSQLIDLRKRDETIQLAYLKQNM